MRAEDDPPMRTGQSLRSWVRRLLRLYPRAWRERYGDEVALVLAEHRVSIWTLLDMLVGALDAHLHGDLLPRRLISMAHRIRTSEIVIFCAFVLFACPWLAIRAGIRDPLSVWERETGLHPELVTTLAALDIAGVLALAAILVGGLPLLLSAIRQGARARRWDILWWLGVPVLAGAALAVYALLASGQWTARRPGAPADAPFTPLALILQGGLALLTLLAVAGSVAAIARVIVRLEPSERVLRFALVASAVATLGVVAGAVATAILVALTFVEAPDLSAPGITPFMVGLMTLAAVLATAALIRGLRAAVGVHSAVR